MKFDWIKTRQTKYSSYVIIYTLVVLAFLGIVNFLAQRHTKSWDSTSSKRYSLSDQTVKVVKGLQKEVRIGFYDQSSRFDRAKDLLERYAALSPKLKVQYVDPDKKPQEAKVAGIREYGAIVILTGDRREEAKSLTEEEITSALIRSLKTGSRTVIFTQGQGEHGLEDSGRNGYSQFKQEVEKANYFVRSQSLLETPKIPADASVLVLAGPRFDLQDPAVESIREYVEKGGRALFLMDPPLKLGAEDYSGTPKLAAQLEKWGVTPQKDLLLDTSGVGQLFGLSEVVPLVSQYESHAIVKEMKGIATGFPLSRSLEIKEGSAQKLFASSPNSFATKNLSAAQLKIDPAKDARGPLTIAAAGTLPKKDKAEGRFVVVGSSGWVSNNFLNFNGNRDLALNMLNWLSSDEDLISIRPKDPEDRRLNLSRGQMGNLFGLSVVLLPLLILGWGLRVWWKRR